MRDAVSPHASALGVGDHVFFVPDGPERPVLVLGQRATDVGRLGSAVGTAHRGVVEALIEGAGLASSGLVAGQMASGRWVQLTRESAARLAGLRPTFDQHGVPMAIVRGSDGQFSHVLRFESLGAAPVAAATLVNGMAVQLALMRIERALEDVRERVDVLIEASKIELEADLAAAMSVLRRIERRADDRGVVEADDWASLAAIEAPIKAAYHQTVRWLDPLRAFLDDERSLVQEVRSLRANLGVRDVGFWLRMYAYGELAMKRWEGLYLLREAGAAPDRLQQEAALILDHARERHEELRDLHDAIVAYLETEPVHAGRFDVLRVVSKSRLRRLHVELATAVNAYGVALNEAEVDVPDYAVERVGRHCGPLLDIDAVQDAVVGTARDAVGAGADAALDVGRWLGTATTTTWQRIRPAAAARDPATPDNAGG